MTNKQKIILGKAIEELCELEKSGWDKELDHLKADKILCDVLDAFGCKQLTELFIKIEKWYA